MGVELMKEYVGIAMKGCHRSASRHPLLVFMILVLIWIYRSFPSLFAFLIDASPVIASTTVLLGILLFFGQSNSPEIQKEGKPYYHEIHNLKFGVMADAEIDWRGVRTGKREKACRKKSCDVNRVNINDNHHKVETDKLESSIDKKFIQETKSGVSNQKEKIVFVNRCAPRNEDDKGWETGSELAETSSPTASMDDIISMLDEIHPLHDHPEVPQYAHNLSNISTDAESDDSEENDQGDIKVKEDEEKEEENNQKSLMKPSDPIDSVPFKPNNQLSHHHESSDVSPSTLMASKQEKQGFNLGPDFVPVSETPDATNNSSMHRQMDEVSDSKASSTTDSESVGSPLTKDDSTSIKNGFDTESVGSAHYEDDSSREVDMISVKDSHHDEDDSNSVKKAFHTESVFFERQRQDPEPPFANPRKNTGGDLNPPTTPRTNHTESVGSSHFEDDPSREVDMISVKESHYEDDSTSVKGGYYPESVASAYTDDDPSREADMISVKDGHYDDDSASVKESFYTESVRSSHYGDDPSPEADLISVKDEDDSTSVKGGCYPESVASAYTEDDQADSNSVKEGYYISEMSDYVSQRSGSSDDDDTEKLRHDGRPDVTDHHVDDEEEDYRSAIMPLTSQSKDHKIQEKGKETSENINSASAAEAVDSDVHDFESDSGQKKDDQSPKSEHDDSDSSVHDSDFDSTVSKPNEGRFPQRLSQVQQGLTSWFKWKA